MTAEAFARRCQCRGECGQIHPPEENPGPQQPGALEKLPQCRAMHGWNHPEAGGLVALQFDLPTRLFLCQPCHQRITAARIPPKDTRPFQTFLFSTPAESAAKSHPEETAK